MKNKEVIVKSILSKFFVSASLLVLSLSANASLLSFTANTAISATCEGSQVNQDLAADVSFGACTIAEDPNSIFVYFEFGQDFFSFLGYQSLFNGNFFYFDDDTEIDYSITTPSDVFLDHNSFLLPNDYMTTLELLVTKNSDDGYGIDSFIESGLYDLQTFDDEFKSTNFFGEQAYLIQLIVSTDDQVPQIPAPASFALLLLAICAMKLRRTKN